LAGAGWRCRPCGGTLAAAERNCVESEL